MPFDRLGPFLTKSGTVRILLDYRYLVDHQMSPLTSLLFTCFSRHLTRFKVSNRSHSLHGKTKGLYLYFQAQFKRARHK